MRVLVLSKEAWRDEQNGGNVLSNIFKDFDAEFAQIYCTDNEPNNNICRLYYQMTDHMMVNNILRSTLVGKVKKYDDVPNSKMVVQERYHAMKKYNLEIVRTIREIVWKIADWNNVGLAEFVKNFKPDVVFAPCYGSHYMIRLTKIVRKLTKVPIISYISDDFYTNRQYSFSLLFWMNHFALRKNIRSVFTLYSLVYTMTDEQKVQCEKDFQANMKILRKSGLFDINRKKTFVNNPIKIVYGGGIYLNRWKTLEHLVDSIKSINKDGVKIIIDIYTGTELKERIKHKLNDGINSKLHGIVSLEELKQIYSHSDIALHVEGFDRKSKLTVRLSFSTKIVDCLDSGCAVMAICDEEQAGFSYLKRNNAAICISNPNEIKKILQDIIAHPDLIIKFQEQAFNLGRKNHNETLTRQQLFDDFKKIANL